MLLNNSSEAILAYINNILVTPNVKLNPKPINEIKTMYPNIKYIIHLAFENRSYHNIFGYKEYDKKNIKYNVGNNGKIYYEKSIIDKPINIKYDLPHDYFAVKEQINGGKMDNFVKVNEKYFSSENDLKYPEIINQDIYNQYTMDFFEKGYLKVMDKLVDEYCLCNR